MERSRPLPLETLQHTSKKGAELRGLREPSARRLGVRRVKMRVADDIRKAVVYIGRRVGSQFVPYGTGFVVASLLDGLKYQTIVTAKHVINRMGTVDDVYVRVNERTGLARELPLNPRHWLPHPDQNIDLIVCPTMIPTDVFDIQHISLEERQLTPEIIAEHDFGVGDDVFIAGMFISILGETKNIPIIRYGIIAAMPEEKIRTEYGYHFAYLIEARSTGGLSGSPAFLHVAPWRTIGGLPRPASGLTQYPLGVVLGHNTLTTNEDDVVERAEREKERKANLLPLNTGIAVVLPFSYVKEAVNQDVLVAERRTLVAQRKGGGS
jgi:hypothetical protein